MFSQGGPVRAADGGWTPRQSQFLTGLSKEFNPSFSDTTLGSLWNKFVSMFGG
jgi:hypothetical protein